MAVAACHERNETTDPLSGDQVFITISSSNFSLSLSHNYHFTGEVGPQLRTKMRERGTGQEKLDRLRPPRANTTTTTPGKEESFSVIVLCIFLVSTSCASEKGAKSCFYFGGSPLSPLILLPSRGYEPFQAHSDSLFVAHFSQSITQTQRGRNSKLVVVVRNHVLKNLATQMLVTVTRRR